MNEPDGETPETLSATQAQLLDQVCDRFEVQWRAGNRPRIEDHLSEAPAPLRPRLLHELLVVELER